MQLKQSLVILTPAEIDDALCRYALSKQGVDPEAIVSQQTCAYRIVDGKIFASINFDQVSPRPREQP